MHNSKYNINWPLYCTFVLRWAKHMSHDMCFPTIWHFDKCRLKTSQYSLLLSLETPNGVQSVA